MDITVLSTRADDFREVFDGLPSGVIPTDVVLNVYGDVESLDGRGLAAEIALGAPDVLAPVLDRMPNLRWVQSTWAGVKPFFDVSRRDYALTGVKDIFGPSMSEYALGWVLALERSVLRHAQATQWQFRLDRGLSELRVGIAGAGSIGSAVATAFKPFVREVRGLNSDGRDAPGFCRCFSRADCLSFAADLNVLVMLLPDTPQTDDLIDGDVLAKLAPDAIVINGGRANALNLSAALKARSSGQLRALVLDVFEDEPLDDEDPLWRTPGVYLTSHTAAPTRLESIVDVFLDNLERYRSGQPLQGLIDFRRGY